MAILVLLFPRIAPRTPTGQSFLIKLLPAKKTPNSHQAILSPMMKRAQQWQVGRGPLKLPHRAPWRPAPCDLLWKLSKTLNSWCGVPVACVSRGPVARRCTGLH